FGGVGSLSASGLRRRSTRCSARKAASTTAAPNAQRSAPFDLCPIEITEWTQDFSCAIVEMKEETQRTEEEKDNEQKTNRPNHTISPRGCSGSHTGWPCRSGWRPDAEIK